MEEVKRRPVPIVVVNRRLGQPQSDDVRRIDDFSGFFTSASFSREEKLDLLDTDEVAALARAMIAAVGDGGSVEILLSSGEIL